MSNTAEATIVQRLAEYPHIAVTVIDQDPEKPEGPVTGSLNRYLYSFPRNQEVVLSEPILRDMEDVVRRGRRRLIISRGDRYTPEEVAEIRLSGSMLVYPDSDALREAAATSGEVKNLVKTATRSARRTRDLAERELT